MRDDFDQRYNAELIRRIAQSDDTAMEELVREYSGLVYSIALVRLNYDAERAEELSQDVFLRVYFNINRVADATKLPSWIAQITRNLAADWIRKDLRKSALVQMVDWEFSTMDSFRDEGIDPRGAASVKEEKGHIHAALQRMVPQEQELLLMHFSEGLTLSQIARIIGKSVSTVKRQLDVAISKVRKLYLSDPAQALNGSKQKPEQIARIMALIAGAATLPLSQKNALAIAATQNGIVKLPAMLPSIGWVKIAGFASLALCLIGAGYMVWKPIRRSDNITVTAQKAKDRSNLSGKAGETNIEVLSGVVTGNSNLHLQEKNHSLSGGLENPVRECPTLTQCLEALKISQHQLSHCQYTYNTSYTVVARNPVLDDTDLRVDERIGTVTLSGDSYLVESRKVSDNLIEDSAVAIFARDENKDSAVLVTKHSMGETATLVQGNSSARLGYYAPLLKMQTAIYGEGSLVDFLESQISENAEMKVTCQSGSDGSPVVQIAGWGWSIDLNKDQHLIPIRVVDKSSTTGPLKSIRECYEVSQADGVAYPSRFNTKLFGRDANGHSMVLQETTVSITMLMPETSSSISSETLHRLYSIAVPEPTSTIQTDKQIEREAAHRAGIEELLKRRK